MTDSGYALYDKRTGQGLDFSSEQIETNIEIAVNAIVAMEANVQHLVDQLKWDAEFKRMFRELPELSEPPEPLI